MRIAADVAKSLGIDVVEARTSASAARRYLDDLLVGNLPLPDIIILDLDLGYESGYELLRFCHGHPRCKAIPFIVWTVMGDEQKKICELFKVKAVVEKSEGVSGLRRALQPLVKSTSQ